jgi:hypothetical protein
MNTAVANIIKAQIESLAFIDRIAGAVRVVSRQEQGSKSTIVKQFPVDCGVSAADCSSGKYVDLVPNSKYKSIHYFEDLGVSVSGADNKTFSFESKLKLVGWLNQKKLGKTDCSVSHLAIAAILKQIQTGFFNDTSVGFTKISITCTGIDAKNASIFSKYSYQEEVNQYLMFPFDYYAINFTTKFTVPYQCIDAWVTSVETNCIDNGA